MRSHNVTKQNVVKVGTLTVSKYPVEIPHAIAPITMKCFTFAALIQENHIKWIIATSSWRDRPALVSLFTISPFHLIVSFHLLFISYILPSEYDWVYEVILVLILLFVWYSGGLLSQIYS